VRLWCVNKKMTIMILGGIEGHTEQVLHLAINGNFLASCGIDYTVKVWDISGVKRFGNVCRKNSHNLFLYNLFIHDASFIRRVEEKNAVNSVMVEHYPIFSADSLHSGFADCVKWLGDSILSKVCEI